MDAETDSSTAPLRQMMRSFFFGSDNCVKSQQARKSGEGALGGRGDEVSFCAALMGKRDVVRSCFYH